MAPNTATKKRNSAKDDDFVLTLSDNEDTPIADNEGEDEEELDNDATTENKKRKRETSETSSKGKNKKQKQQEPLANGKNKKDNKNKKGKKGADTPEPDEGSGEEDEEEEENAGEDDGALNPDFEFDVAGANQGVTEGFDGWGIDDGDKKDETKNGDKKGVDIDDIISRRQARKEAAESKKKQKETPEVEGDEEAESDEGMEVDFKDDELLADDGFGMGADGEDESDQEAGSEPEDEDDSD